MTAQRITLRVAVVVTVLLLQACIVNRLRLPLGAPDLLVVVVVAFALVGGSQRGAVLGFFAGLMADVLPPAHHFAGELAFAYAVIGYVAGMLDAGEESSVATIIGVVAGASISVVLLYAALGDLLGNARITADATLHAVAGTVVYDVILAPFVVPLVSAAARRLEPAGTR
ncbi:MAG TPA: rod shape-determining protein MreD [Mycobacteriales bacterium]|jgi:rod shape-determining protein MreD|nr:rod shape-determining protein MreD [Mycobacteriales bacterium]